MKSSAYALHVRVRIFNLHFSHISKQSGPLNLVEYSLMSHAIAFFAKIHPLHLNVPV